MVEKITEKPFGPPLVLSRCFFLEHEYSKIALTGDILNKQMHVQCLAHYKYFS